MRRRAQQRGQPAFTDVFDETPRRTSVSRAIHKRWTYDDERQAVLLRRTREPMRFGFRAMVFGVVGAFVRFGRLAAVGGTERGSRRGVNDAWRPGRFRRLEKRARAFHVRTLESRGIDDTDIVDGGEVNRAGGAFETLRMR